MTDLTGQAFGRLTVTAPKSGRRSLVRCVCGKFRVVHNSSLRTGRTQSCGCLRNERTTAACVRRRTADPEVIRTLVGDSKLTHVEIARRVGVSRERVRQIAKRFGQTGRGRLAGLRKERLAKLAAARKTEEERIWREWETEGRCESKRAAQVINRRLALIGMKRCSCCNSAEPLDRMSKDKDGYRLPRCAECNAKMSRAFYAGLKSEDPVEWNRRQRAYRQQAAAKRKAVAR